MNKAIGKNVVLAVVLLLTGCGDYDDDESDGDPLEFGLILLNH